MAVRKPFEFSAEKLFDKKPIEGFTRSITANGLGKHETTTYFLPKELGLTFTELKRAITHPEAGRIRQDYGVRFNAFRRRFRTGSVTLHTDLPRRIKVNYFQDHVNTALEKLFALGQKLKQAKK